MIPPLLSACHSHPILPPAATQPTAALSGLTPPTVMANLAALAVPPEHWQAEPLKHSDRHNHQVWLSPTGRTAYGVIRIWMPLPVGPDLALIGVLREMRRTEGESNLISKEPAPQLPGLRFVAEGGRYRLRDNLVTYGWTAWVVYAGTLQGQTEAPDELALAERARDATVLGLPK